MAPHTSTLAWKIQWTEEPGGLQSMGSLRVGHDWATSLSLFTFMHWRRKWQPTPVFLPEESQGWWSPVGCHLWGRTESDQLKWLSSSSSTYKCTREYYSSTKGTNLSHLASPSLTSICWKNSICARCLEYAEDWFTLDTWKQPHPIGKVLHKHPRIGHKS